MQHLDPKAAHAYLQAHPRALLIDCRTEIEHMYVGHPVGAEHVAWQEAPDWEIDPEFADKVKRLVGGDLARPLLLICRSGVRSIGAATAATEAGYANCYNVLEGFEGDKDANGHRGNIGGWRKAGLPWIQG